MLTDLLHCCSCGLLWFKEGLIRLRQLNALVVNSETAAHQSALLLNVSWKHWMLKALPSLLFDVGVLTDHCRFFMGLKRRAL